MKMREKNAVKESLEQSPMISSEFTNAHMENCAALVADDNVSFNLDNLFGYIDARLQARIVEHHPNIPPYDDTARLEGRVFESGYTDWKLAAKYLEISQAPVSQWVMIFGRAMGRYLEWNLVSSRDHFTTPHISSWDND